MSNSTNSAMAGLSKLSLDSNSQPPLPTTGAASSVPDTKASSVGKGPASTQSRLPFSRDVTPAPVPDIHPFVGPEAFYPNIDFQELVGSPYSWSPFNTMLSQGCQNCHKMPSKACTGCDAVKYCSKECQRAMWTLEHKDNCGKTYADRLENVLRHGQPLWYSSIFQSFGFSKVTTGGDMERLRQVYLELLDDPRLGVAAEHLVQWRSKRILKEKVSSAYTFLKSDPDMKPRFAEWFANNEKVLDFATLEHDPYLTAWRGLRLPKVRSEKDYRLIVTQWTDTEVRSFMLFHKLFYGMTPDIQDETYRFFGFCVCNLTAQPNLVDLGGVYIDLIKRCGFRDFVKAIDNDGQQPKLGEEPGLIRLFKAKGLGVQVGRFAYLEKVLFSREFHQAVWFLKQYVISKAPNCRPDGFFGYKKDMEEKDDAVLTAAYYDYLVTTRGDPMALHRACVDDVLPDCVRTMVPDLDLLCAGLMVNGVRRVEGVEVEHCGCVDEAQSAEFESIYPMNPSNHGLGAERVREF